MPQREDTSINKRAARFSEITSLLRDKARTAKELADWFNQPVRTINRDLADLGVQNDGKRPPRYAIHETPAALNPSEAIAAHAALRLLYHHSPDRPKSYQRALEKLAKQLPESIRATVQHSLNLDASPSADTRTLEVIANAWMNRHALGFDYIKPGGSGEARYNEMDVYFVEVAKSNLELYVIGQRRNWQPMIRTYRLGLIRNAMPLPNQPYEIPSAFDPRAYLSNAWGVIGDQHSVTVRLKFDPSVSPWLEERRFPGVTNVQTLEDGSKLYTIQTGVDSSGLPRELIPWIRGWGANVEVLEPPALREKWLVDARDLIARHGRI